MQNKRIKKVTVELTDGTTLDFDKQIMLFAEDEMSNTEKKLNKEETCKVLAMVDCETHMMASVTESLLGILEDKCPGLDSTVMMKHLGKKSHLMEVLEAILAE